MLDDLSTVIRVVFTCYRKLQEAENQAKTGQLDPGSTMLIRCLYLLGLCAQHAKIDTRAEKYRSALGLAKGVSPTGVIAQILARFCRPVVPESLRKIAVLSYGKSYTVPTDNRFPVSWKS
jgi:hypothetical protein